MPATSPEPTRRRTGRSRFAEGFSPTVEYRDYAFVYDELLSERKFERPLAELETRLTTLGITGRTVKLAMFRSAKDTIEQMVQHGVTTVVVVGNDRTLDKVMWFVPDLNIVLGYLPLMGESSVAAQFGIPVGVEASEVLAARFIETIDLGMCEGRYFLTEIKAMHTSASLSIEGQFALTAPQGGTIRIRNLFSDMKDGLLEVIVRPDAQPSRFRRARVQETRLLAREGELTSPDPIDVSVDSHLLNGFQFHFKSVPKKLRMITSRSRLSSTPEDSLSNEHQYAMLA